MLFLITEHKDLDTWASIIKIALHDTGRETEAGEGIKIILHIGGT